MQNLSVGIPQSRVGAGALSPAAASEEGGGQTPVRFSCAVKGLIGCAWRTVVLLTRREIHQPTGNRGRWIFFADGSRAVVYRETVIERPPPVSPTVLVVCVRLRHVHSRWNHTLFRLESELNTVLFAGFSGLISKLWLDHDENDLYRGFYQWDDPELALAYVWTLWWVLALVSERGSISYAVLPELDRDAVLSDPEIIDDRLSASPAGWWRPVKQEAAPA